MAAKKNTRNNDSQGGGIPWGPMLLSFAVGVFVMFLLHLKDNVPEDKSANQNSTQKQEKKTAVEPKFDFYTLLPEMEVVVEEKNHKPKQPVVMSPSEQTPSFQKKPQTAEANFMLQVGSFKKMADADAFRARLALLGIESKVQTVTIDNKETWHRVQIGPVAGRDQADKMQKQLRENGFDSLLMKAKHS